MAKVAKIDVSAPTFRATDRIVAVPACVAVYLDDDMVVRRVTATVSEVVFIRGIFEASDGIAAVFSEKGGELWIAACASRAREMDALLADLERDLQGALLLQPSPSFSP